VSRVAGEEFGAKGGDIFIKPIDVRKVKREESPDDYGYFSSSKDLAVE